MSNQGDNLSGTNLYLGRGGVASVDFSAPVAFLPADGQTLELPTSLQAGAEYTVVARNISVDGVEEHSLQAQLRVRVAPDGATAETVLPTPIDLLAEILPDGRTRLSCLVPTEPGLAAAGHIEVFAADADSPFDTDSPIATAVTDGDGEAHVTFETPSLPCRLSARCVLGEQAGELARPVCLRPEQVLSAPVALLEETS